MSPTPWNTITSRPFFTVSPVGTSQGYSTNNGADFGPDTSGTMTSGIQEALNAISGVPGGTVYCLAGPNPASYPFILKVPIGNTGNDQDVVFESGSKVQVATTRNSSPTVGSVANASGGSSTSFSTAAQSVATGGVIYVQIATYNSSSGTPTVGDTQGGTYFLLSNGVIGSISLWIFRRNSPVNSSTSFQVNLTVPSSTTASLVAAIEVINDGTIDTITANGVQTGTGTSESVSLNTSGSNELVLFLGVDALGTSPTLGTGQTAISGYPSPSSTISAWGSYQSAASSGYVSSSRTVASAVNWAALSIAISPIPEALIWVAQNVATSGGQATATYHNIRWLGNGCVIDSHDSNGHAVIINNLFEYTAIGPGGNFGGYNWPGFNPVPTDQAYQVEIDDFELIHLSGNATFFATNNGDGNYHPTGIRDQAAFWVISRLHVHSWVQATAGQIGRIIGIAGVRNFNLDRIFLDCSDLGNNANGWSGLQIWANRGDCADIRITNSLFLSPSSEMPQTEIIELQGAGFRPSYIPPQGVGGYLLSRICFENCAILAGGTSRPGLVYIDDDNSTNGGNSQIYDPTKSYEYNLTATEAVHPSFVTDVEFRQCEFLNTQIEFRSSSWVDSNNNSASWFGYIRFVSCRFRRLTSSPAPLNLVYDSAPYYGGALLGRGPSSYNQFAKHSTTQASPIVPTAPPYSYTYINDWGFDVLVIVEGGSGVTVAFNGQATGKSAGTFLLETGDQLTIAFSTPPSIWEIAE